MDSIKGLCRKACCVLLVAAALGLRPAAAETPLAFYPLTPCRLWDTRPGGAATAFKANTSRSFPVRGLCGVPAHAEAVALNLTVVRQTDLGNLRAYPANTPAPNASVMNFQADGAATANGALIPLSSGGDTDITIQVDMPQGSAGTLHNLADVTGYFAPVPQP
jgi:hypothetical protein